MQDRFKFRGIHPVLGELQEIKFIDFIHNTVDFGDGDIFNIEDVKIQQCTGLKDKNGKLIYEGDIVTYDDRDIYPYHTPILNAIIEMRKYQWCMIYYRKDIINANTRKPAEQKTWLGFDDFITSRIEVIGNIYENKELLTGRENNDENRTIRTR